CFVEAVAFAALATLVHAIAAGRGAVPVLATVLALFGVALLLVSIMREIKSERTSTFVLVVALAGAVGWGFILPTRDADGFALLSRAVLFGILGEAYLWRILSIARGATRWTDARNAAPFAGFVIALAVLLPLPADHVDRGAFAPLALIVVAAAGLALSLARTTEELALSRGTTGSARASSATSATVVLGAVAIVAAALMPGVQDLLGAVGNFISPIVGRILYLLILPFAYLAGALDDGTPVAAIRLLYWRFLGLAERYGPGWRGRDETPSEHARRAAAHAAVWREADPIVRAFEDVRYGELRPQEVTVMHAREALAS